MYVSQLYVYLSINAKAYTDAHVCVCVCVCHATAQLMQDMRELVESALQCKLKLPDNLDRW